MPHRTAAPFAFALGSVPVLVLAAWAGGALSDPTPSTPAPNDEALVHRPVEGQTVERRFEQRYELEEDYDRWHVNGELVFDDDDAMRIEALIELAVEDRYLKVREGQLLDFLRRFETAERSFESEYAGESHAEEETSPLEGRSVRFRRGDAGDTWRLEYEQEPGDLEWLEELEAALDLAAWLPEDAVEPGDTWELPAERLRDLMEPTGSVPFDGDDETAGLFSSEDWSDAEGRIEATLVGWEQGSDGCLARIGLAIEVASGVSTEFLDGDGDPVELRLEAEFDFEGWLLWSPGRGHAHGYALEGRMEVRSHRRVTWTDEDDGEAMEMIQERGLSGAVVLSGTWRVEAP